MVSVGAEEDSVAVKARLARVECVISVGKAREIVKNKKAKSWIENRMLSKGISRIWFSKIFWRC